MSFSLFLVSNFRCPGISQAKHQQWSSIMVGMTARRLLAGQPTAVKLQERVAGVWGRETQAQAPTSAAALAWTSARALHNPCQPCLDLPSTMPRARADITSERPGAAAAAWAPKPSYSLGLPWLSAHPAHCYVYQHQHVLSLRGFCPTPCRRGHLEYSMPLAASKASNSSETSGREG